MCESAPNDEPVRPLHLFPSVPVPIKTMSTLLILFLMQWLLAYVDDCEDAAALLRHRFPSKVGGAPAWLNPARLPTQRQLTCLTTQQHMLFLLQVRLRMHSPHGCSLCSLFLLWHSPD